MNNCFRGIMTKGTQRRIFSPFFYKETLFRAIALTKILEQKDLSWVSIVGPTFRIPSMNFLSFKIFTYRVVIQKAFTQFTILFLVGGGGGNIYRQIRISRNLGAKIRLFEKISNVSKPRTKSSNYPHLTMLFTKRVVFSSISVRVVKFNDKVIKRF